MSKRQANKLTAREVATVTKEGWHGDGAGLWLRLSKDGRKSWVFVYKLDGRRYEMGFGTAAGQSAVSLQAAREAAQAARSKIIAGGNPLLESRAAAAAEAVAKAAEAHVASVPTFGELAEEYLRDMAPKWRNAVHARQWKHTLREYAKPLAGKRVDSITTNDVLECLKPHWVARPETACRLRNRIELVLDAATARGFRSGSNPAAWRGNLKALLPARSKLSRGHHAALPYKEMAPFIADLRAKDGFAAKALEFCILTATRTGEVLQATWAQINLQEGVWIIPATAMKAGREHRVPLCERALELLEEMEKAKIAEAVGYVFPGSGRRPLSNMAMSSVLKRMNRAKITVHGFRSTFRDFASEATSAPHEVAEMALAHTIANKAEAAYRRGDLFDKRRELMKSWAAWCETKQENVIRLSA